MPLQQLEQLGLVRERDVVVGEPEARDVVGPVRVVGGDERDRRVQLAAAVAPQQVHEAVVLLAHQHGHALRRVAVGEPPAHVELRRHLLLERASERGEIALLEVELHAHEELAALGVGRVLVGADDVRSGGGEEARDRGDDAVPVVAGDQQAAVHDSSEATSRRAVHASSVSGWRPPGGSSR